jgi:acetolactate synthase small subunit
MTITVMASGAAIMQVVRQIEGVEEVLAVLPSSRMNSVHREVSRSQSQRKSVMLTASSTSGRHMSFSCNVSSLTCRCSW